MGLTFIRSGELRHGAVVLRHILPIGGQICVLPLPDNPTISKFIFNAQALIPSDAFTRQQLYNTARSQIRLRLPAFLCRFGCPHLIKFRARYWITLPGGREWRFKRRLSICS